MKFSVNWLREFIELPASTEELTELLTLAGVEIERVEKRGADFDKVIVAQITDSSPHPNADRLTVCRVNDGSDKPRQIVCGATNYKVGDKVPLALPGAVLPNDLQIRTSKLRGIESEGMLCSGKELALSDESAGLLILPVEAEIGAPIGSVFPSDTILDVEITPNRGDLLSHFGLAREITGLVGQALRLPDQTTAGGAPALQNEGVRINASHECPFYSARRIDHVKVGPSPDWLRAKIETAGIRSINNIVDISNFVMLELGQPTHAFDADKLKGEINVRLGREGEKFLALDGKTYALTPENLIIADSERAVGIGGVMGGEETGVTASTKNVLLESAYFLPASVRRTARNLNLPSDASYRFERGVDPDMILPASERAAGLIREIAGGKPAKEIAVAGKLPPAPPDVALRYEKCDALLGLPIPAKTVDQILEQFELSKSKKNESGAIWKIPSHRRDLQRDVDLIEEVVRSHGIDKVPAHYRSRFTSQSAADRVSDFENALRQRLVALGLFEVRTSALIPRSAAASGEGAIELRNPLSEDHVLLRPSLVRGLLDVLARNQNLGAGSIRLFELGRIFVSPKGTEKRALGLLFSGTVASGPHWRAPAKRLLDFFDLKGAIEALPIRTPGFRRGQHPAFALAVEITAGDELIGLAGQLGAKGAADIGAAAPVLVAQLDLDPIFRAETEARRFAEIDKYPAVTRDIAMLVPENVSHEEIVKVIAKVNEPLLEKLALFDLFSGEAAENLGAGRRSLAYSLTYRDKNRTLTSDEVSVAHDRIRERLKRELDVELRE